MLQHQRFVPPVEGPARASVLIRTRNEAKELAATLIGVFDQTLPPHEVIVIDSGSTDATVAIAQDFPVILMEIAPEDFSYSGALNTAARRATGDVLVCLSAHCRPVSDRWLESLCRHFADPEIAGAGGPGLRPERDVFAPGQPSIQRPGTDGVHNRTWGLSNADSAIRRSLWAEVPFDEDMPATEDKAWGKAMLDRGYSVVHDPAAAVWHPVHTVANEFHRNLAVQAGFRRMFPELEAPYGNQVAIVARQLGRNLRTRMSRGDLVGLWHDVQRVPGVVSALLGGVLGVGPGVARLAQDGRRRVRGLVAAHRARANLSRATPTTHAGPPLESERIDRPVPIDLREPTGPAARTDSDAPEAVPESAG